MFTDNEMSERESRIFNAAIEIFSKKGYNASTTKDIAQEAGVAEGTIFHYYKTKKDILHAITKKFMEIMGNVIIRPVEEMFKNAGDKELKPLFHDLMVERMQLVERLYPVASIVITEIVFREDLRETIHEKFIKRIMKTFRAFHAVMAERGLMRADVPPEAILRSIIANIMLFIAQHKLFPRETTHEEMEKEFDILFDIILNGVAGKAISTVNTVSTAETVSTDR